MWLIVETTGAKVEGYWVEVTGRGLRGGLKAGWNIAVVWELK